MAVRYFARQPQDAIGRSFVLTAGPSRGKPFSIVGVIHDAKYNNLREGRLLVGFLYGLSTRDPTTIWTAAAILTASGTLAAALPAPRAARVDPNVALRCE